MRRASCLSYSRAAADAACQRSGEDAMRPPRFDAVTPLRRLARRAAHEKMLRARSSGKAASCRFFGFATYDILMPFAILLRLLLIYV